VMIDLKQAYQQSDCHEAAIQTLWISAYAEEFQ
jgi:hypothetical protein